MLYILLLLGFWAAIYIIVVLTPTVGLLGRTYVWSDWIYREFEPARLGLWTSSVSFVYKQ